MFLAFLSGLLTGLFFAPITLVPVCVSFLVISAGLWSATDDPGMEKLFLPVINLVILNVSYLLGVIVRRWWADRH